MDATDEGPQAVPAERFAGVAGAAFGLIAATLLALQIVLSRLFGSTLSYYYAFMLISLAMLGLAAGSLATILWPRLFPADRVWQRASILSLLTGLSVAAAVAAILVLYPEVTFAGNRYEITNKWILGALFWSCFPPFLLGGTVVSGVLSRSGLSFHHLYAIDLVFASSGCLLAVVLLDALTPTQVLLQVLSVLPIAAAALFALRAGRRRLALVALAAALIMVVAGRAAGSRHEISKPPHLAWRDKGEVVSEWNSMSAVRVHPWTFFTWSLSDRYSGPAFPMMDLLIDGMGGTPIVRFDGKPESLAAYEYLSQDLTALAHVLVPPEGRQLVIGPGGGVDVLQAVRAGRRDVTVVEINRLIEEVVNTTLAGFSGSPYRLPGVTTVIDNGRTFVKRAKERWDLITLTWVDTGGSATALAFSENYLYTVEAFSEYLDHLTDEGVVAFLRSWDVGFRVDSLRGVAVAAEALAARGVADPGRHLLIAASRTRFYWRPMCLVLIRPRPFTADELAKSTEFLDRYGFDAVWMPDGSSRVESMPERLRPVGTVLHEILRSADRKAYYAEASLDVTPSTDDNPFYFVERAGKNREAGIGVREISTYAWILGILVVPVLLLPLLARRRDRRRLGRFGALALAYFALLGLSFMLVEIEFFHVFSLVLGSPTLTLSVVLSALLVFSGLGSLLGAGFARGSVGRRVVPFALLGSTLALFSGLAPGLLDGLVEQSLAVRILGTGAVIAPLAFLMGILLPLGMSLVADREDLVLWGWAVNGAFSVFASVLAIYLAIHVGISTTFRIGMFGYLLAGGVVALLARERSATAAAAPNLRAQGAGPL